MTSGSVIAATAATRVPSILAIRDLRRRLCAHSGRLDSLDLLTALLALDPATTCRALGILLAPLHGSPPERPCRSIGDVANALGRSGLQRLFDVPELLPDGTRKLRVLWLHAIATACAARRLAKSTGVGDPDHAYLAGLVHDTSAWARAALGPARSAHLARTIEQWLALTPPSSPEDPHDDEALATPPEDLVRNDPASLIVTAERLASLADLGHRPPTTHRSSRLSRLAATSHEALILAHEIRHDVEEALAEFGLGSASETEAVAPDEAPADLFGRPCRPAQTDMVLALLQCKHASSYKAITTLATASAVRFLDFDRGFYVSWHPKIDRCFVRTKTDLTRVPIVRAPVQPTEQERETLDAIVRDGTPLLVEPGPEPHGLSAWLGATEMILAPLDRGTRASSFLVLDRATSGRRIDPATDMREVAALAGFVTLLIDNFRLRVHRLRARRDATIDTLTRLANRGFGMLTLEQSVARARRTASPLCVLMVDLDEFKALNDRLGHLAGDHALRLAAQVLRRSVRRADTVCRYGGEEFLIVLPDTGPQEASLLAARLFTAIDAQSNAEGLPVTASIGLASLRHGEDSVEDLLQRADRALYTSKVWGRNRFSADTE